MFVINKAIRLEKARARTAQWRLNNPGKDAILHEKWRLENPEKNILNRSKQRAKQQDIPFTITVEDIVIPSYCPVFGIELNKTGKGKGDNSMSIDRVDNNKGYVPGNIRIISNKANLIKGNGTAEEHLMIAEYMIKHIGS